MKNTVLWIKLTILMIGWDEKRSSLLAPRMLCMYRHTGFCVKMVGIIFEPKI